MKALLCCIMAGVLLAAEPDAMQVVSQLRHWSGQGVAPVYEGFDINPDGSFNMWFGYMNRNYEEELDIPIGPDNKLEARFPAAHRTLDNRHTSIPAGTRTCSASPCRRTLAQRLWCGR
jgi:hypothetical protein